MSVIVTAIDIANKFILRVVTLFALSIHSVNSSEACKKRNRKLFPLTETRCLDKLLNIGSTKKSNLLETFENQIENYSVIRC